MESQVQTFDNTKYCLYFTIPSFLQFLNYNSQIGMFPGSMFHASTCFTFKVCQYLKLKTCLWSCKKEWFNLELEPKIDLSRQSGMSSIFRNSTVTARSPFQYKTKPNCLQESKKLFKKIYKEKDIIFSCYLWTNNFFFFTKNHMSIQISWTASKNCSVNVNHCKVPGSFPPEENKPSQPSPFVSVPGH